MEAPQATLTLYRTENHNHATIYYLWVTLSGYNISEFEQVYKANLALVANNPQQGRWPIPVARACALIIEHHLDRYGYIDESVAMVDCRMSIQCWPQAGTDQHRLPPAVQKLRKDGFMDWWSSGDDSDGFQYRLLFTEQPTFEAAMRQRLETTANAREDLEWKRASALDAATFDALSQRLAEVGKESFELPRSLTRLTSSMSLPYPRPEIPSATSPQPEPPEIPREYLSFHDTETHELSTAAESETRVPLDDYIEFYAPSTI